MRPARFRVRVQCARTHRLYLDGKSYSISSDRTRASPFDWRPYRFWEFFFKYFFIIFFVPRVIRRTSTPRDWQWYAVTDTQHLAVIPQVRFIFVFVLCTRVLFSRKIYETITKIWRRYRRINITTRARGKNRFFFFFVFPAARVVTIIRFSDREGVRFFHTRAVIVVAEISAAAFAKIRNASSRFSRISILASSYDATRTVKRVKSDRTGD